SEHCPGFSRPLQSGSDPKRGGSVFADDRCSCSAAVVDQRSAGRALYLASWSAVHADGGSERRHFRNIRTGFVVENLPALAVALRRSLRRARASRSPFPEFGGGHSPNGLDLRSRRFSRVLQPTLA